MISPDLNANMDGHLLGPAAWNFVAVSVVGGTLGKLSIFKITNASPSGLAPDIPSIRILSGRLDPFPRRSSVWRPQRRALAAVGAVGSCRLKRVNSHEKAIKVTPFVVQRCDYARSSSLQAYDYVSWGCRMAGANTYLSTYSKFNMEPQFNWVWKIVFRLDISHFGWCYISSIFSQ